MVQEIDVDFVVVGAGSAGCVIANRLSQSANNSVALVEAGGWDNSPWIHLPVGYFRTMHNPAYDWCFSTNPTLVWATGSLIGHAAKPLVVPHPSMVCCTSGVSPKTMTVGGKWETKGWGWDDVLPLFKRAENFERGGTELRGVGGGLNVSDMSVHMRRVGRAGYPFNPDYNGPSQRWLLSAHHKARFKV